MEQMHDSQYLGCDISWGIDRGVESRLSKFKSICRRLKEHYKVYCGQKPKLNVSKVVAMPPLHHGGDMDSAEGGYK